MQLTLSEALTARRQRRWRYILLSLVGLAVHVPWTTRSSGDGDFSRGTDEGEASIDAIVAAFVGCPRGFRAATVGRRMRPLVRERPPAMPDVDVQPPEVKKRRPPTPARRPPEVDVQPLRKGPDRGPVESPPDKSFIGRLILLVIIVYGVLFVNWITEKVGIDPIAWYESLPMQGVGGMDLPLESLL